jgi:hypothetical protein
MRQSLLLIVSACVGLGCSDEGPVGSGPPPTADGAAVAGQFERLADSVDAGGYSPTAEALRHAAEIVRLTGHATPVTVSIDDADRSFLAVSEQIDFPQLECTWSDSGYVPPPDSVPIDSAFPPIDSIPPDSGGGMPPEPPDTLLPPVEPPEPRMPPTCTVVGLYSMRTLIAWEPERMNEVVRLVAHIGNSAVNPDVPDVMTELPGGGASDPPGTTPPDSGSGSGGEPGGWPGFMGEYLVRDVGSWMAFEGNQSNELEDSTGSCTADRTILDWAEFGCRAARIRFAFTMGVEPLNWERLTGQPGPEGRHTVAMSATVVDGVRLRWEDWSPPQPPDTTATRP